jgi:hypothetical protein
MTKYQQITEMIAVNRATIINKQIRHYPAIASVRVYRPDNGGKPSPLCLDVEAYRTHNAEDENRRYSDLCGIVSVFEKYHILVTENGGGNSDTGRIYSYTLD